MYRALVEAHPPNLHPLFTITQQPEDLLRRSGLTARWVRREVRLLEEF